jgi:hypothetical protein
MPVETKLPDDHPMMVAWKKYQENAGFKNSMNWIRGALWKTFVAGYSANKEQDNEVVEPTPLNMRHYVRYDIKHIKCHCAAPLFIIGNRCEQCGCEA